MPKSSSRSPTSTARWWAARASISMVLSRSCRAAARLAGGWYNRIFLSRQNEMLYYLAVTVYVLVCLVLMLVVLLQQGKGGDIASAFGGGGGSQTAFGARSGATVLSRATTVGAVLFVLGALVL